MTRKISAACMAMCTSCILMAQDTSKTNNFKISGSADVYYRYDFNNPKQVPYNSLTSFSHAQNSFELGMVSLKAEHTIGKVGMLADLGFGTRAEEFSYNDENTKFAIKQAYITYAPASAIKLTFGSWTTHIGYEVLDAYLNRNYSMSYMFSFGPFAHTGIKADVSLGGKTAFMLGVANPTDFKGVSGAPKTIIGQLSTALKDDKLKAYFNITAGKQNELKKLAQEDLVLTYAVSEKFSLGYNGTFQSIKTRVLNNGTLPKEWIASKWWGSALYFNYDPASWAGITLRGEYIEDPDNYVGIKNVFATTISGNFKIDNLTIIPEFRLDAAQMPVFYKGDIQSAKSAANFILAATYHF